MVRFAPEHVVLFLCLCDSSRKERHEATTRNCVPQGMGRARHIPPQNDTVVRFAPEHVVLFLCLCDSGRKERHKAATRNCAPQGGRARHIPPQNDTVLRFVVNRYRILYLSVL